ncbi:MAG: DUF992 domain-containing protein [Gammaproteobacteria bacterium]|nr:DUF992 domain-containing protein [Gammaproteobacteria bacterium]
MLLKPVLKSLALVSALSLGAIGTASAQAVGVNTGATTLQLGVMKCHVLSGTRVYLLIRSTADVECTWEYKGATEKYSGETGIALGLDLSFKENEDMAFTVLAGNGDVTPGQHSLAGKFVGGTADAALGVGVGVKVLVGGGKNNISLQPLALSGSTGSFGASAGLGFLYLEAPKK